MRRAVSVATDSDAPHPPPIGSVTLSYGARHRRRVRLTDDDGIPFLLDLPRATVLAAGNVLLLECGDCLEVRAASERVVDITCRDPVHLARLAWHIGNRHVPLQVISTGMLRIQYDHVLLEMIEGLGGVVAVRDAPFDPERGAYGHHA